ncbi:MAG: excisionase family DNA-binding protein [Sporichthyaceae bacterium]
MPPLPSPRHVAPTPTARPPIGRMLLTVEEAAQAIGVGRSLMYELIATGAVRTVRVGRLRRIRPEDLRDYVTDLARQAG